MKLLSQKDPRWGNEEIGQSGLKIRDYGCTITVASMFLSWYQEIGMGVFQTPDYLAKTLNFTKDGKVYWKSFEKVGLKFVYRYYYKDDKKCLEILKSKYNVCLLQVNNNHWVALVGYSRIYGLKIADPYYKEYAYLSKRGYKVTGFTELGLV